MEDNRFFKFAWRFNAIIFMVAGILVIVVLIYAGYQIIKETTRKKTTRNIVNVDKNQTIDEKWELGRLYKIDGTRFVMLPLTSDQSYAMASYSKSSNSVRNYLFIDTRNNNKRWLFQTNRNLIADIDFLNENENEAKERTLLAILYRIISKDTNGDKRLTKDDKLTIAISLPSGRGYKEVIHDIDRFLGHDVINRDRILLIFQKDGTGYTADLSLSDFSISNENEIPKINGNPYRDRE